VPVLEVRAALLQACTDAKLLARAETLTAPVVRCCTARAADQEWPTCAKTDCTLMSYASMQERPAAFDRRPDQFERSVQIGNFTVLVIQVPVIPAIPSAARSQMPVAAAAWMADGGLARLHTAAMQVPNKQNFGCVWYGYGYGRGCEVPHGNPACAPDYLAHESAPAYEEPWDALSTAATLTGYVEIMICRNNDTSKT